MFQVEGDRPKWMTVYERISVMEIGQVVTHEQLAKMLPGSSYSTIGSAFRRAMKQTELQIQRSFTSVRTVGYRMVDANEHERLAHAHHARAKRQLRTSKRKAASADRSRLNHQERARIDAIEMNLSRQIEMTNRLEARVVKVENDLKDARREQRVDSAELSERVDRLASLLERNGITDNVTT